MQSEWALAPGSQSVVFGDSARSPSYLVTVIADRGRERILLCLLHDGSCAGPQAGVAEFISFVYIMLEKEA